VQEDKSSSVTHNEKDDFENTCVGKDEVETKLTFLKDITLDDSTFESHNEGDLVSPLEDDIGDYLNIEKEKWKHVRPQFYCALIYDTDKEDEAEIGSPFLSGIIYDDVSIDAIGKEKFYFPFHNEGQLEVINFPVRRGPIFDTKEISKATTSPKYDAIFKSPKPYDFGEEKPFGYKSPPTPLCHPYCSSF